MFLLNLIKVIDVETNCFDFFSKQMSSKHRKFVIPVGTIQKATQIYSPKYQDSGYISPKKHTIPYYQEKVYQKGTVIRYIYIFNAES